MSISLFVVAIFKDDSKWLPVNTARALDLIVFINEKASSQIKVLPNKHETFFKFLADCPFLEVSNFGRNLIMELHKRLTLTESCAEDHIELVSSWMFSGSVIQSTLNDDEKISNSFSNLWKSDLKIFLQTLYYIAVFWEVQGVISWIHLSKWKGVSQNSFLYLGAPNWRLFKRSFETRINLIVLHNHQIPSIENYKYCIKPNCVGSMNCR